MIHVSHLAYTSSGWTGVFSVTQQFVYLVLSLPQSDVSLVYCLIRYHRYNYTFDNFFLEFLLPVCGLLFLTFMPYTYAVAVLSFCPLILKVRCLWTNTHISSLSIALLSSFSLWSLLTFLEDKPLSLYPLVSASKCFVLCYILIVSSFCRDHFLNSDLGKHLAQCSPSQ